MLEYLNEPLQVCHKLYIKIYRTESLLLLDKGEEPVIMDKLNIQRFTRYPLLLNRLYEQGKMEKVRDIETLSVTCGKGEINCCSACLSHM